MVELASVPPIRLPLFYHTQLILQRITQVILKLPFVLLILSSDFHHCHITCTMLMEEENGHGNTVVFGNGWWSVDSKSWHTRTNTMTFNFDYHFLLGTKDVPVFVRTQQKIIRIQARQVPEQNAISYIWIDNASLGSISLRWRTNQGGPRYKSTNFHRFFFSRDYEANMRECMSMWCLTEHRWM